MGSAHVIGRATNRAFEQIADPLLQDPIGGQTDRIFDPLCKAAQRSLAESLARSLGPSGIHVSLIIIDGIVDEPSIRAKLAGKPDSFFVKPDDIADTAVMLIRQKPSAWTFELEARPFGETW